MSRTALFVLFALVYGIVLLVTAPATLLGAWIGDRTHNVVRLAGAHGTIWRGSAVPVFYAYGARPVSLGRISWKISLFPLVHGIIELQVNSLSPQADTAEIDIGAKKIELRHTALELPAALLEEIHPLLKAVRPQGNLQFSSDHLVVAGRTVQGTAAVKWLSAGSSFSAINPFGSYLVALDGMGSKIAIRLTTIAGPLLLDGHGNWSFDRGLAFQARAKAAPGSQEALAELLHHLGPEGEPGTWLINIGQAI